MKCNLNNRYNHKSKKKRSRIELMKYHHKVNKAFRRLFIDAATSLCEYYLVNAVQQQEIRYRVTET